MMKPVTELDPGFSDPGATATDWDEVRDAIASAQLFWITTVRRDGRPHVTPLVAVWLDYAFLLPGPSSKSVTCDHQHDSRRVEPMGRRLARGRRRHAHRSPTPRAAAADTRVSNELGRVGTSKSTVTDSATMAGRAEPCGKVPR